MVVRRSRPHNNLDLRREDRFSQPSVAALIGDFARSAGGRRFTHETYAAAKDIYLDLLISISDNSAGAMFKHENFSPAA